jgi:hypothetical protein
LDRRPRLHAAGGGERGGDTMKTFTRRGARAEMPQVNHKGWTGWTVMAIASVAIFIAMVGCSGRSDLPDLGLVSGTVFHNGKPVPLAKVVFRPVGKDGGRMTTSITDSAGVYRLVYLEYPKRIYGTKPGPQQVFISTQLHKDDAGGPKNETLPSCYHGRDTVLTVDVKPGARQTIDWKLDDKCSK